jgi:hypothetical protein
MYSTCSCLYALLIVGHVYYLFMHSSKDTIHHDSYHPSSPEPAYLDHHEATWFLPRESQAN